MGLVQMHNLRSYWESELAYEPNCSVLSRDRFLKLVSPLHFVDNNAITDEEKKDKVWKLRTWVDAMRQNFLQIPPKEFQFIDEITVPFKGRSGQKYTCPKSLISGGLNCGVDQIQMVSCMILMYISLYLMTKSQS